jgi:hypothetical protein
MYHAIDPMSHARTQPGPRAERAGTAIQPLDISPVYLPKRSVR